MLILRCLMFINSLLSDFACFLKKKKKIEQKNKQTKSKLNIVDYVIASVNPLLSLSSIITLCLCSFIPSALRDHLHLPPFHFALSILVTLFSSLIKLIISHLISVPTFQPCLLVDGVRSLQQTVQHL